MLGLEEHVASSSEGGAFFLIEAKARRTLGPSKEKPGVIPVSESLLESSSVVAQEAEDEARSKTRKRDEDEGADRGSDRGEQWINP